MNDLEVNEQFIPGVKITDHRDNYVAEIKIELCDPCIEKFFRAGLEAIKFTSKNLPNEKILL